MMVYRHNREEPKIEELVQYFRRESPKLKALKRVTITRESTTVFDVNGDTMEFAGLTYGDAALEALLRELQVVFNPATLHNPDATPDGIKEYRLSARYPWGHDRIL